MNNDIGTQARRTSPAARHIAEPCFNGFPVPDKSINASNSTETPFIGGYTGLLHDTRNGKMYDPATDTYSEPNNASATGINPKHSLETAVL